MGEQYTTKKKKGGCLWYILIPLGVFLALWSIADGGRTKEDYNDNSTTHQILAKNYLKDYIKDNLKDADSYEEVSYSSRYNSSRGCYEVQLKYRAKNSFGALVLEQVSGDVYFKDDDVSIGNVHTE